MDRRIKQTSILSYWTLRYLLILCLGLLVVTSISVYWINRSTKENKLQMTGLLGLEIADRIVDENGRLMISPAIGQIVDDRKHYLNLPIDFCLLIMDAQENVLYTRPRLGPEQIEKKLADIASGRETTAVTTPVMGGGGVIGSVILTQPQNSLTYFLQPNERILLVTMLAGLTAMGWLTIYLLSRKLSRPIREVAAAAHSVSMGQYDIHLEDTAKEREISELIVSFKGMASRLKQLEEWRTMMLAGVTHELKTPVTSIKGLLHAVREGVVEKEESDEFLDIALKESQRLQVMVEDLIDYNAFTTGFVEVRHDLLDITRLVAEICYQWQLVHEGQAAITKDIPPGPIMVLGDASRIQQIVMNLLNNSLQARRDELPVRIAVRVYLDGADRVAVEFADNGGGIPAEEQPHIFEQFYRGENKKLATRGLGLGLTFSRMLAEAQGSTLCLKESSPEGTVFVLRIPLSREEQPRIFT
ncbi:HAMP domain-containing sensor histidine kinase [Paenibacillus sp. y28]|uniref:HAMP domain-containing sensor histidine kinase n=1 Tax=Paenibacillus sp. y28 TaxID=3129110 RepID=UPI003015DEE0